jgi:SAM-dependent methyltransferase
LSSKRHCEPSPTAVSSGPLQPELEDTYRRYRQSGRKRRAWAADNRGNQAIRAELLAAALDALGRPPQEVELLDVGCGGGWLLAELADRGASPQRLHGVDLLPERVAAAQGRLPGADVRRADARRLPFEPGRFDAVAMLMTLSSIPQRRWRAEALAEAARVVRDDGIVLTYEPWLPNPFNPATRRVSAAELRAQLGAPLATRRLTGLPPLSRRLGPAAPRLYPLLARLAPTHRLTAHAGGGGRC